MPKFHVIDGTPAPDTPKERSRARLRKAKERDFLQANILQCPRCGSREMMQTKIGMTFKNGKATGGTPQWICASCHRNGERVVIA